VITTRIKGRGEAVIVRKNTSPAGPIDLQPKHIEAAIDRIAPIFRGTPQFVDRQLSRVLGRDVLVKVETFNPIGSFKARGASVLVRNLDPTKTWVCSTAGNFGQALAYLAGEQGAFVDVFVSSQVPSAKVARMRALGARVDVHDQPAAAARAHAGASEDRVLVIDGREPAMAAGAGTIGIELASAEPIDTVVVQIGDGALIAGVACWLASVAPKTRVVGVCASGAPAMARSLVAGRPVRVDGAGTIATALAITEPVAESLARVTALVDEIVLVDDDDLRRAAVLIADCLGVLVEPAGAAGVAALLGHGDELAGGRTAVILTGAGGQ
jgi:threonine dehydratase